jgi:DNA-binding NarL/FixJ family response regulator
MTSEKTVAIRVAAVDDDPLRLIGLHAIFDAEADFHFRSSNLADIATSQQDDVILLAGHITIGWYDTMLELKRERPDVRVIVTGPSTSDEGILEAIAAGAKGYVDEAANPSELKQAIRAVYAGSVWAPGRVLSLFIERVTAAPPRVSPQPVKFTPRELKVLRLLVAGESNLEIAHRLKIKPRTVKEHVARLMRKTGAKSRVAVSLYVVQNSLLSEGDEEES